MAITAYIKTTTSQWRIKGENTHTVIYQVETDSFVHAAEAYLLAIQEDPRILPLRYDVYEFDTSAYCLDVNLSPMGEAVNNKFLATCTFGKLPPGEEPDDNVPPASRPVKYRLEWGIYTKDMDQDAEGADILNTAGQPLPDPVQIDSTYPMIVCTKNFTYIDDVLDLGVKFRNALNTKTFWGFEKGKVRCMGITAGELQYESDPVTGTQYAYYPASIRLGFRTEGWTIDRKSEGFQVLDENGDLVHVIDDNEAYVPDVKKLQADGTEARDGDDVWADIKNAGTDAKYWIGESFEDFTDLGLPAPPTNPAP